MQKYHAYFHLYFSKGMNTSAMFQDFVAVLKRILQILEIFTITKLINAIGISSGLVILFLFMLDDSE